MFPHPDTGTELSAIGEGTGEGGERVGGFVIEGLPEMCYVFDIKATKFICSQNVWIPSICKER